METNNNITEQPLRIMCPIEVRAAERAAYEAGITEITRGVYNEIVNMPPDTKKKCRELLEGVKNATKIDEHGGWDFGILDSNYKKGMVHSISYDWYAVGNDIHDGGFLAVVQVREYYKKKDGYFPQVRKSYFLMGQNEDNTYFAHPVESRVIHSAINKGKDVLLCVQSWIFGTNYENVVRQGDICLVPVRSVPKGENIGSEIVLEQSHRLTADKILQFGENIFCVNPYLVHTKSTHPPVKKEGKYKVVIGKRTESYSFAKPTLD